MITHLLVLLASASAIYVSCEFFVNGVEWVGRETGVTETAVGTVLAAFGTALPESVVTLVAVAFGDNAADRMIGVGAALGGPLVLSTVAYAVVGFSLMFSRAGRGWTPGGGARRRLTRDQAWFLAIFLFKIGLGLVAFAIKPWLGVAFVAAYALYLWAELCAGDEGERSELEPLKFRPSVREPGLKWALVQTAAAAAVIFVASQVFVGSMEQLGPELGLAPAITALLLSPIATELPETMNAVIWVRQGKPQLALANISGAMMIQATIPSALGLFFTRWLFTPALVLAGAVTTVSIVFLLLVFRRGLVTGPRLAMFVLMYGVFAGFLFAIAR